MPLMRNQALKMGIKIVDTIMITDLMKEAAALEKSEKFADALAKLEEIKQKFEQKFWPEGLEKKIRDVKAKKEALEFFGVEGPKKAPKTP